MLENDNITRQRSSSLQIARLMDWLSTDVWPLWLERGVDWDRRGFHEHLDHETHLCGADFRRLRVAARQVYTFAQASLHGVEGAPEAVQLGIEFLRAARQPDGGYPWVYNLAGQPVDHTRDLYDHAFVLLAYSTAAPVLGRENLRSDALATAGFITQHLRHERLGFSEALPPTLPRRQNPHMHLLEAVLTAYLTFRDDIFLDLGQELMTLFLEHFFRATPGALAEFFDEGLRLAGDSERFLVEPGHHYEWVWLLDRFAIATAVAGKTVDPALGRTSAALLDFADRNGVDGSLNLVVDEVDSAGRVSRPTFRLWPQAERIKCEARRSLEEDAKASAAMGAIWQMITGAPAGLWHERLDADGRPMAVPSPASSLYHLTCAITDAQAVLAH